MSVFHGVPGVPLAKMERFAGVDTHVNLCSCNSKNKDQTLFRCSDI